MITSKLLETIHQIHGAIISSADSKWAFLIYHLPFLFQVSLLHQKFYSDRYERYQVFLKLLRLFMVPVNIYFAFEMKRKFCLTPITQRGPFNLQYGTWVLHLAMKSIEWGIVSTFKGDPTYRIRPEFQPAEQLEKLRSSHEQLDPDRNVQNLQPGSNKSSASNGDSLKNVFIWSFQQLSSLRGINFNWGWKGRKQPNPSIAETLRLMVVTHFLQTLGLLGCILSRDYGTPKSALLAMGFPEVIGLETIAELLSTFSWGLLCIFGLEFSFCFLTLTSYLINFINQFVVKLPIDWMDWWDLRLFVPLFHDPFAAQSLASLWGLRWHQIYRRSFLFLGALPASNLALKFRLNLNFQRIFGLFGAFFVSAILHESLIRFVAPPPHATAYEHMKKFPGSLFYFLMQPVGILVEPYVIGRIPRLLGGGRLWVLFFTLVTAWPFKNQYTAHFRVIDDIYPPLKAWPLYAFIWPPSIMQF